MQLLSDYYSNFHLTTIYFWLDLFSSIDDCVPFSLVSCQYKSPYHLMLRTPLVVDLMVYLIYPHIMSTMMLAVYKYYFNHWHLNDLTKPSWTVYDVRTNKKVVGRLYYYIPNGRRLFFSQITEVCWLVLTFSENPTLWFESPCEPGTKKNTSPHNMLDFASRAVWPNELLVQSYVAYIIKVDRLLRPPSVKPDTHIHI